MAIKIYATDDPATKKLYDEDMMRLTLDSTYFNKFESKKGDSCVYVKDALKKSKGDTIKIYAMDVLDENKVIKNGQSVYGSEQVLSHYNQNIAIDMESLAARADGGLSSQRVLFEVDDETESALKRLGAAYVDKKKFDALTAAGHTKVFLGKATPTTGVGAVPSGLAAGDKITPRALSFIKTGMLNGWNKSQQPMIPYMVDGKEHIVCLVHDDLLFDFKQDPTMQAYLREAEARGKDNPLFTGATAVVDGVILHSHRRLPIFAAGLNGATVPYGEAYFLGQKALCYAPGPNFGISVEPREHNHWKSYCWDFILGCERVNFTGLDYDWAVVKALFARTQVSD